MHRTVTTLLLVVVACQSTNDYETKSKTRREEFARVETELKAALAPIRVGTRFDKALDILNDLDLPNVYIKLVTKSETAKTGSYMYEVRHWDGHLKTTKTLLLTVRWKVNQLDGEIVQVTRS